MCACVCVCVSLSLSPSLRTHVSIYLPSYLPSYLAVQVDIHYAKLTSHTRHVRTRNSEAINNVERDQPWRRLFFFCNARTKGESKSKTVRFGAGKDGSGLTATQGRDIQEGPSQRGRDNLTHASRSNANKVVCTKNLSCRKP